MGVDIFVRRLKKSEGETHRHALAIPRSHQSTRAENSEGFFIVAFQIEN
jgi:hypothetical protein